MVIILPYHTHRTKEGTLKKSTILVKMADNPVEPETPIQTEQAPQNARRKPEEKEA